MLVAEALRNMGPAKTQREAEKNIVAAVDTTAKRLGNTRSVCRKYYIHPVLIEAYLEGEVLPPLPVRHQWNSRNSKGPALRQHEMDVLGFIKARLKPKARRHAQNRSPKPQEGTSAPSEGDNGAPTTRETAPHAGVLVPTRS
jgi:DNA topoisomerase-1